MSDFPQLLELVAAIMGIICVFLQTRENILAWPFGMVSVLILVYIFNQNHLLSDMILHIIYVGLNAYGWWYWSKQNEHEEKAPIKRLDRSSMIIWTIVILIGAALWGYGMTTITSADLPYIDAFTTVGSLCAQFLLAKKVLQNWLIWIVVDVVAVNVYLYKELYFTAIMFFVFLLLCIKGYIDWRKAYQTDLQAN